MKRLTECFDPTPGSTEIASGDKSYPRDFRRLLRLSGIYEHQGKAKQQNNHIHT
jgi:hypothetical protein